MQGNGDIHQAQSADGAVKAAVNAWCGGSYTTIKRSFGPAFTTITVSTLTVTTFFTIQMGVFPNAYMELARASIMMGW